MKNICKKMHFLNLYLLLPLLFWIGSAFFVNAVGSASPSHDSALHSSVTEHVIWNREPLRFVVPVGQERLITFPGRVTLHNTDKRLTADKISILNNAGTLYIRAKTAFDPVRVNVILKSTGQVILVDLSSKVSADDAPVEVVLGESLLGNQNKTIQDQPNGNLGNSTISYVTLMRYAIQHLYSPTRLIENSPVISRAPMYTSKSVHLFYGDPVMAMPLISWHGGDLYVSAVLLKNTWQHSVQINPKQLRGHWLAVSLYPSDSLSPQGSLFDRTTLFLISDRPFANALESNEEVL